MFKIPEWEDDVPKNITNFEKKTKNKRRSTDGKSIVNIKHCNSNTKISTNSRRKIGIIQKSGFDKEKITKTNKIMINNKVRIKTKSKKKSNKEVTSKHINNQSNDNSVQTDCNKNKLHVSKNNAHGCVKYATDFDDNFRQSFDIDKPDEVLLNAKKRKMNDTFKSEDIEEILFNNRELQNEPSKVFKSNDKPSKIKNIKIVNGLETKQKSEMFNSNSHDHPHESNSEIPHKKKLLRVGKKNKLIIKKALENKQPNVSKISVDNSFSQTEPNSVVPHSVSTLKKHMKNKFKIESSFADQSSEISNTCVNDSLQQFESQNSVMPSKVNTLKQHKQEKFQNMTHNESALNNRKNIKINNSTRLRARVLERLKAAQFRYINEKLYTSSGSEAKKLFQTDPATFQTYHNGYQQQLKKWPLNPLDIIVKKILKLPKSHTIVDMGCGEAALARRVPHVVRSFDLVAGAPGVEPCDMAHTPLATGSVDVAVYCLALMGTDLTQYLLEANRVLKEGGLLLIAEVESRCDDVDDFSRGVQRLGFRLKRLDKSHKVFFFMDFIKTKNPPSKKSNLPQLSLKPCLYKKR